MRPRNREQDPPSESSPTPSAPPTRIVGNLSSMVVRPSNSGGGGGGANDFEHRDASNCRESPLRRRRESPMGLDLGRRRRDSPIGFHRRDSPPSIYQRSPPTFQPRSQRFHSNPGYMPHAGSISPPPRRPKLDDYYEPEFDRPVGQRFGRGFRGGRGGGRFRDVSPHDGFGRGGRSIGRGYMSDRRGSSPPEGEYVHRNDPNLSPREGDWICGNPRCGNLNFARRSSCNNCNKPRFAPGHSGPSRSPRRGYFTSPPSHGSPPSFADPVLDRGPRRETSSYRSPPRGWATEAPRDFGTGSPPPRRVNGRFQDRMRRDDRLEYEDDYRGRGKSDWHAADDWERRDGFVPGRRGYDQRPTSPRDRWVREPRDRSRSPLGVRPVKSSYIGRGRDDRRYDDSYMGRGRVDEPDRRGFHREDDSFVGRGRGNRRGMGRGRISGDRY